MQNSKTCIGFIGFGRVVEWQIKQTYKLDFNVKFIVDTDPEKLLRVKKILPKAKLFNNLNELFNDKHLDENIYVVIATPSGTHFKIAQSIASNKNWKLIIEKPTFLYFDDFNIASNWNNSVIPVFQNRYNKSVIRAKQLINRGCLGKITHASLSLDWNRPQRYYDLAKWRGTWLEDGGVSTNQGIHYFDITRHLIGKFSSVDARMKRLSANIECEDYLNALFIMESGIPLDVRMTTAVRHQKEEASLVINGSMGTLKLFGICCNLLDFHSEDININQYGEDLEMPYGYGHKTFFKLISGSNENEELKLPTLNESFETMQFIYSCYSSAISGTKSFPSRNYSNVPLGKKIEKKIYFE